MTELTLQRVQRHTLAADIDREPVSELVRGHAPPHPAALLEHRHLTAHIRRGHLVTSTLATQDRQQGSGRDLGADGQPMLDLGQTERSASEDRLVAMAEAGQRLAARWGHQPWSDSWARLVAATLDNIALSAVLGHLLDEFEREAQSLYHKGEDGSEWQEAHRRVEMLLKEAKP